MSATEISTVKRSIGQLRGRFERGKAAILQLPPKTEYVRSCADALSEKLSVICDKYDDLIELDPAMEAEVKVELKRLNTELIKAMQHAAGPTPELDQRISTANNDRPPNRFF